jgi:hypothetical protein
MVERLMSRDERALKLSTYNLQRLIRESQFRNEFLRRGGLDELVDITLTLNGGNTLAYALTSTQNLMESTADGWDGIKDGFVGKVSHSVRCCRSVSCSHAALAGRQHLGDAGAHQCVPPSHGYSEEARPLRPC